MAEERDSRQKPQYGELAPEGWEWKPPAEEGRDSGSSGRITGVPHNLGVTGTAAPAQPSAPAQQPPAPPQQRAPGDPPPYRADDPAPSSKPRPQALAAPGQPKNRSADRVITIVLLVIGALGALYTATSLYQMPSTFSMMATALDVDGFTMPSSLQTISTVGALLVFTVYALNVIYSIQRLRRRRITFWVPLTAGVVAGIIMLVFTMIGMTQSPELMQALSQPDAPTRMLDYMSTMSTP